MNLRLSRSRMKILAVNLSKVQESAVTPEIISLGRGMRDGNQQDLPVLAIEMSMHVQGHRLRRVRDCLANAAAAMWPSPSQDKIGTRKW